MKEEHTESSIFGKRIFELRKERDWSQPELGRMIDTSGAIIGRYERGDMGPSIGVARKLAEVFGVTLDYLISDAETPDTLKDR
jgi:transcriptional regulator with XRE-family HTH domain